MAMNTYDPSAMVQGANTWRGGEVGNVPGGPGMGGYGGGYGDINPEGAAADPFGYTEGSLLTPWQGRFTSSGYGGGYNVPAFNPFNYADFAYNAPDPGRFTENYADPAAFRFADFAGPDQFKAPTKEEMQQDPGYQARVDAAQRAATAAGAHGGVLNTGGFAKGLAKTLGDQASQEYGNVYNRRASEWERNWGRAKDIYGINQGNTKTAFDTNVQNRLQAHQTRGQDWRSNADVALQQGQLGYQIATGTWDRNMALARQGYEDKRAYDQQVAAAGAANANQQYERDLADYNRARDEFWTNQDRQSALLDREATRGLTAANIYGSQLMGGYGAMAGNAIGGGDARASGIMGSGNAWGGAANSLGGTLGGLALYGAQQSRPPQPAPRLPNTPMTYGLGNLGTTLPGTSVSLPSFGTTYSGMPTMPRNQALG